MTKCITCNGRIVVILDYVNTILCLECVKKLLNSWISFTFSLSVGKSCLAVDILVFFSEPPDISHWSMMETFRMRWISIVYGLYTKIYGTQVHR